MMASVAFALPRVIERQCLSRVLSEDGKQFGIHSKASFVSFAPTSI